jgi:hypothetical protein
MSKEDTKDLIKFIIPFSEEIQEIALWLREFAGKEQTVKGTTITKSISPIKKAAGISHCYLPEHFSWLARFLR